MGLNLDLRRILSLRRKRCVEYCNVYIYIVRFNMRDLNRNIGSVDIWFFFKQNLFFLDTPAPNSLCVHIYTPYINPSYTNLASKQSTNIPYPQAAEKEPPTEKQSKKEEEEASPSHAPDASSK